LQSAAGPQYEARLRELLHAHDWEGLREFTREHNQIPDEIYNNDRHFWEVLMHKLICNRIDTLALHEESGKWLAEHGYTADLGGY
jgi:hypothetical protein